MVDTNKERTIKKFNDHAGEMVLVSCFGYKVWQFVAIAEDENDYLYVLYDGRELSYNTILDHFIPLKGKLDDEDYNSIVRDKRMNSNTSYNFWGMKEGDDGYDKIVDYANTIRKELSSPWEGVEYLSDFEWDFK